MFICPTYFLLKAFKNKSWKVSTLVCNLHVADLNTECRESLPFLQVIHFSLVACPWRCAAFKVLCFQGNHGDDVQYYFRSWVSPIMDADYLNDCIASADSTTTIHHLTTLISSNRSLNRFWTSFSLWIRIRNLILPIQHHLGITGVAIIRKCFSTKPLLTKQTYDQCRRTLAYWSDACKSLIALDPILEYSTFQILE